MYKNKFIIAVLVNGEVIKESGNGLTVLPTDTEYALRLRNKNNRRCVVKIYIDGENISEGGIVIGANSFIDIERPVNSEHKFKFVSLSSPEAIAEGQHEQNQNLKQGVVTCQFTLEKLPEVFVNRPEPFPIHYPTTRRVNPMGYSLGQEKIRQNLNHIATSGYVDVAGAAASLQCSAKSVTTSVNTGMVEQGCTVQGSKSNQSFVSTYVALDHTTMTELSIRLVAPFKPTVSAASPTKLVIASNQVTADQTRDSSIEDLERQIEETRLKLELANLQLELADLQNQLRPKSTQV